MTFQTAILASAFFLAGSALAQTPVPGGSQGTPPQRQQGSPAQSSNPPGQADQPSPLEKVDPAKEAAIRHLMDITQTSKLGENAASSIAAQVRSVIGRALPPERLSAFMETFTQKFNASAPASAVTDAQVPIYSHFFSMEDIQGLIKFYESPLGQRVVKTLPQVFQQTQSAAGRIDGKAALDVLRGMSGEYPEIKSLLPPENEGPGAGATPAPGVQPTPRPSAPQP